MNVGADYPEAAGDYYAWGETKTKGNYQWYNYFDTNDEGKTFEKYSNAQKWILDPEDDVVHVKWGGNWRMPTMAEFRELKENCTYKWTTLNGMSSYLITGDNGNSIFLPAAGYRKMGNPVMQGSQGHYWFSTLSIDADRYAHNIAMAEKTFTFGKWGRFNGFSIRAVCPE